MRDFSKDTSALALNTATLGHNLEGHGAGWSPEQIIDACAARGMGGIVFWRREIGDRAVEIGDRAEAILRGLQDPATLPDPEHKADPTLAAPGLAHMIHAAGRGNVQALTLVSQMAEQMSRAGGDMARIAGAIRPMINGERDPDARLRGEKD